MISKRWESSVDSTQGIDSEMILAGFCIYPESFDSVYTKKKKTLVQVKDCTVVYSIIIPVDGDAFKCAMSESLNHSFKRVVQK